MATSQDTAPHQDASHQAPTTNDYLRHLWNRRFVIVALCGVCVVATYIGIQLFHPNVFEARSQIMVRAQPRLSVADQDIPGLRPPAFQSMFTSDETISFVRNQYNEAVRNRSTFAAPGVEGAEDHEKPLETPLEKLRPWFRAQSATTVDTTIQREFSPVIELRSRGTSPGQALVINNLWLNHVMNEYGNFMSEEAEAAMASARLRSQRLSAELGPLSEQRQKLESDLLVAETRLAGVMRQLTSAPRPNVSDPISDSVIGWNMIPGARESSTRIEQGIGAAEPGLLELRTKYQLEIARLESGGAEGELGPIGSIKGRLVQIDALVGTLLEESAELTDEIAALTGELAQVRTETNRLEYAIRMTSSTASQAEAVFRPIVPDAEGHAAYGTLRVVARPVVPNDKVWPPRTVLALLSGGGLFMLLLLLFTVECYMRHVIAEGWRKDNAAKA